MNGFTLYLYGSQIAGQARTDSDFDLLYFTNAKALPDMPQLVVNIYQLLGIPINKKLDIKIYYLWKPAERLVFPSVIVHQGAKLIQGTDLKNTLILPTVKQFIEFNKKDIYFMISKLKVKTSAELKNYFLKTDNLKPLYNISFNLGNIEFMEKNDRLNCDGKNLTSEHFMKASSLIREKYRYKKIDPNEPKEQLVLEQIIDTCLEKIRQLK